MLATLIWVSAYFVAHGVSLTEILRTFSVEFAYWAPVLSLGIPGVVLDFHGRRLRRGDRLSIFNIVEIIALIGSVTIIAILILMPD